SSADSCVAGAAAEPSAGDGFAAAGAPKAANGEAVLWVTVVSGCPAREATGAEDGGSDANGQDDFSLVDADTGAGVSAGPPAAAAAVADAAAVPEAAGARSAERSPSCCAADGPPSGS
ncbi:hypothetical protein SB719_19195, partial [Pantoea sp. SIMBA_079]|uniref:hypothetical protein n=1 Tax=Pantoea sp. SIMBA_079 TaxID=3085817 RepID=UPI003992DBD7